MATSDQRPPNAKDCGPAEDALPLQGIHHCYPDKNGADPDFYVRHPGLVPAGASPLHGNRDANVSAGFNMGLLLLPYVMDYGNRALGMTRRRAYPVVFHSFASHYDRAYATASISYWVPQNDKYFPSFIIFLCQVKPFAGYRWNVYAAKRWLTFAQNQADKLGGQRSTTADVALGFASSWIDATRKLWEELTVERFPYDPPALVSYWKT